MCNNGFRGVLGARLSQKLWKSHDSPKVLDGRKAKFERTAELELEQFPGQKRLAHENSEFHQMQNSP